MNACTLEQTAQWFEKNSRGEDLESDAGESCRLVSAFYLDQAVALESGVVIEPDDQMREEMEWLEDVLTK